MQTINTKFNMEEINQIKKQYGFKDNFNLIEELEYIDSWLENFKQMDIQPPHVSKIKENLSYLVTHINSLLHKLESTLPMELKEFDKKYASVYLQKQFKDIGTPSAKLSHELRKLNSVCHSISTEIGTEFSKSLMDTINDVLTYIKNGGITISGMINDTISIENITTDEQDFTPTHKHALELLIIYCKYLIKDLGNDSGRPYNSLARNFLLKLAVTYQRGTEKKPTTYKSVHTVSGYDGAFYDFAMACAPFFNYPEILFNDTPAFVGDMAIETLKYLKELRGD